MRGYSGLSKQALITSFEQMLSFADEYELEIEKEKMRVRSEEGFQNKSAPSENMGVTYRGTN